MAAKNIALTRKEYDIIAKSRGIQRPQDMSIEEVLNILSRYESKRKVKSICRKLRRIGLEKIVKIRNIYIKDLNKAEKLQEKSIDELKTIARLRRIKNFEKLTKEDLILTLLKSESSALEKNFSNNNTNDDDDTYDDKIRGKISDIRMVLSRLWNTITNKNRKKIKKELYEIEKNQNLSDMDLDYYGIKDIENLFDSADVDSDNYYKPILIKTSFENNYKIYESKGDKNKSLSVRQYFYKTTPYLSDLINNHKTNKNKSSEWKIQLNMSIKFISSNDTGEICTIYVWSDNEEIRSGNETDDIQQMTS